MGHGDHHDDGREDRLVRDDLIGHGATAEQRAAASGGHQTGSLEDGQRDGQITRVLRDLGRARLPLLLQGFESWDDDGQQLKNDAGRDVRHDAEREDRDLQQCTTAEHVDQAEQAVVALTRLVDTCLDVLVAHSRYGNVCPEPIEHDDAEREEQLLAQVGRLERPGERGEHGASCDPRAKREVTVLRIDE